MPTGIPGCAAGLQDGYEGLVDPWQDAALQGQFSAGERRRSAAAACGEKRRPSPCEAAAASAASQTMSSNASNEGPGAAVTALRQEMANQAAAVCCTHC